MNYRKSDPVGIDKVIDDIQKRIYDPLLSKWGYLDIYGRVYRKVDESGSVNLERYVDGGDYEKVTYSEGNKIFFVQDKKVDTEFEINTCDLWIVCVLDIQEIYKTNYRETERARLDLCDELYKVLDDDSIKGIQYGMSSLRSLVEDSLQVGNFKFTDIHPYHLMIVRTIVEYPANSFEC